MTMRALYPWFSFLFLAHTLVFTALLVRRRNIQYLGTILTFLCLTSLYTLKWMSLAPTWGPFPVILGLRLTAVAGAVYYFRRVFASR